MASIREDRRRLSMSEFASGRRPTGVLVLALVAVLAAIALILGFSQRPAHRLAAPIAMATAEPAAAVAPPAAPSPPAADPRAPAPPPARAASSAPTDEGAGSARERATIARVISDGRPGLKACYQRALTRDETLVYGDLTVRLSIAASGKVGRVSIAGPPEFREVEPCLEAVISRWSFPAAPEPYAAEFPLVLSGNQ
jgi:hypothetical protein